MNVKSVMVVQKIWSQDFQDCLCLWLGLDSFQEYGTSQDSYDCQEYLNLNLKAYTLMSMLCYEYLMTVYTLMNMLWLTRSNDLMISALPGIWNMEYRIWNIEYRIWNMEYMPWLPTLNSGLSILNSQECLRNVSWMSHDCLCLYSYDFYEYFNTVMFILLWASHDLMTSGIPHDPNDLMTFKIIRESRIVRTLGNILGLLHAMTHMI